MSRPQHRHNSQQHTHRYRKGRAETLNEGLGLGTTIVALADLAMTALVR